MWQYSYAGGNLCSEIPIPELIRKHQENYGQPCRFLFQFLSMPPSVNADTHWIHHRAGNSGDITHSLTRLGEGYLLRFPLLADFVISNDGRRIAGWAARESCRETIRHLLLDQVLPRLLSHQGHLVLHAGGVTSDHGAIVFLGESGLGKSTLCSSFNQAGFALLSDDFLLLSAQERGNHRYPQLSRTSAVAGQPGSAELEWRRYETHGALHKQRTPGSFKPGTCFSL